MKNNKQKIKYTNHRIKETILGNALIGNVKMSKSKTAWVGSMYIIAIVGGILTYSPSNFLVFSITTSLILCLGHSIGMHRRLIHQSFECPKWLEYFLVHLGVIVGIAGPEGMIRTHDMRDWAQRHNQCHDYFAHKQPFLIDGYWQIFCDVKLDNPPEFQIENEFLENKFYSWMERTWMWQQIPLAIVLFILGGVSWVIWGICVRVSVSVTGHWLIGYFAHNHGERNWHVENASVQGYNIKFTALLTMGESWHNNHHAFPGSALLGIEQGQMDPGWWVIKLLEKMGFIWNIKLPEDLPIRPELLKMNQLIKQQFSETAL